MRHRLYIPDVVRQALRDHIELATRLAAQEFLSASEDEDAMTGHLGARLQITDQRVLVAQDEVPGVWKWGVSYTKFRGRGRGATEKQLGADGIVELVLDRGYRVDAKSMLFQAKMPAQGGRRLLEQSIQLSTWREAAVVVEYSPSGFSAFRVDDVISARGNVANATRAPLGEVLGGLFVDCEIGDNDLRYDARARQLIWRTMGGEVVAVDFRAGHRIKLRVNAPKHGTARPGIDRVIEPAEIHRFRMEAQDDELLGPGAAETEAGLKASHRRLALAYHPDRMADGEQLLRDLLNRRTQEMNDAAARIRKKKGWDT